MNVQAILSIILALFCSLLITLSVCVQGNCSNTVKNHALQGKHFKRLYNIDWLACIQSCNLHRNCYSYNFCFSDSKIQRGTCELNDCWIQIQQDLWSRKPSLVFVQDCIFQQFPRQKKVRQVCNWLPFCERFIFIQKEAENSLYVLLSESVNTVVSNRVFSFNLFVVLVQTRQSPILRSNYIHILWYYLL